MYLMGKLTGKRCCSAYVFLMIYFSITICIYLCFSGKVLFQFLDFGFIIHTIRHQTRHVSVFKGKVSCLSLIVFIAIARLFSFF